jgi:dipeptidase
MAKSKISFQSIGQYAWFIWELTSERMKVNKVLNRPIIQNEGLTACIPRYKIIKKGVIKDVPENMELENLMQHLNSDNYNKLPIPFQVINAVRLKMRVKETSEDFEEERWWWKESRVICLTFRTKELAKRNFTVSLKTPKGTGEKATLKGTTGMACLSGSPR